MAEGIYTDRNGQTVTVTHTRHGYLLRYKDGRVVSITR